MKEQIPFDVISRFGDKKSLRVTVEFKFRSRVDGDVGVSTIFIPSLDRYQQKTQLDETKPVYTVSTNVHTAQPSIVYRVVRKVLKIY